MREGLYDVVKRYSGNPVLTPDNVPYETPYTHNAAVCTFEGKTLLLFRTGLAEDVQALGVATSDNGVDFVVEPEPVMLPEGPEEGRHVYDARITQMGDVYYVTYATESKQRGIRAGIARTLDFKTFERLGLSEPDNRNTALFPGKIGGQYVRLTRPFDNYFNPHRGYNMWISYSPDLVFWGRSKLLLSAADVYWGERKVGAGGVPIKTSEGWLEIFHGVDDRVPHKLYRLGCMLLDLEDPSRIRGRAEGYILEPEAPHDIRPLGSPKKTLNVVFSCGAVVDDDGTVRIYYGAADRVMCLATARLQDLVELCLKAG